MNFSLALDTATLINSFVNKQCGLLRCLTHSEVLFSTVEKYTVSSPLP